MKSITLFLITPDPYMPDCQTVAVTDPDPSIDYSRRTLSSGFAEPYLVSIPDHYETATSCYDELYIFDGETALTFELDSKERMRSRPACMTAKQATAEKCWRFYKSVRITN